MARTKKSKAISSKVTVSQPHSVNEGSSIFDKFQIDFDNRQSLLSLILGVLIVFLAGVLVFNYLNRSTQEVGILDEGDSTEANKTEDVKKENLPGQYTVKEGDTLFIIAQKYYDDGYLYSKIVEANNLANENLIEVGQVLQIPKIEQIAIQPISSSGLTSAIENSDGQGGAENQTIWGEKISGDSYTVVGGDWLSKISGRAYGDIYAYQKIAQANNITNPDLIEPGMVLKIPR